MAHYEYCELWWSDGYRPQLTFYKPMGAENVAVEHDKGTDADAWESFHRIVDELGYNGWELISAPHHGAGLLFKRRLQ
ncbi:MAG: hypothetical protein ACM3US_01230 [Sphingomonadaceae bacterium]